MINSIFNKQNDREILLLQKAQRSNYTRAKIYLYSGFGLSVFGTIIFLILTTFYNNELLNTVSSFSAICIFSLTLFFEKKSNYYIELAAKIQQTIDIRLFQLPDTCNVLLPSEIKEIVALYPSAELSEFKDWYSDYSQFDFEKQVFCSQKENVRWNKNLREKYFWLIKTLAIVCPILLLLYKIFTNATMSSFFAAGSWVFPLEQFLITQWSRLRDNINYLKMVNDEYRSIERCYEKYSSDEIICKLCGIQTYIFEHRKKAVMIPDWFYKMHQQNMQKYEDNIATETKK